MTRLQLGYTKGKIILAERNTKARDMLGSGKKQIQWKSSAVSPLRPIAVGSSAELRIGTISLNSLFDFQFFKESIEHKSDFVKKSRGLSFGFHWQRLTSAIGQAAGSRSCCTKACTDCLLVHGSSRDCSFCRVFWFSLCSLTNSRPVCQLDPRRNWLPQLALN